MKIELDEGYFFGMGVFETIAVENGKPVFLKEHLNRLSKSMETLQVTVSDGKKIEEAQILDLCRTLPKGRQVLKICVSENNVCYQSRENTYRKEQYEAGFTVKRSEVKRNETSPFTYIKSLNCGENIWEKRKASKEGFEECIFANTKGEVTEGSVSNLFFVKNNKIYTPPVCCGMLPGVMRQYVLDSYLVEERHIIPEEIVQFDEMFLTNSLMGVMPVKAYETHVFSSMQKGKQLAAAYFAACVAAE